MGTPRTYGGLEAAWVEHPTRSEEVRYVGFERGRTWVARWTTPWFLPEDQHFGDFASLFRASLIVGVGFERRIAGTTALMVGLTYNNSLFSTHKDQTVVKVDASGVPRFCRRTALTTKMMGHDSFMALTLGVVF